MLPSSNGGRRRRRARRSAAHRCTTPLIPRQYSHTCLIEVEVDTDSARVALSGSRAQRPFTSPLPPSASPLPAAASALPYTSRVQVANTRLHYMSLVHVSHTHRARQASPERFRDASALAGRVARLLVVNTHLHTAICRNVNQVSLSVTIALCVNGCLLAKCALRRKPGWPPSSQPLLDLTLSGQALQSSLCLQLNHSEPHPLPTSCLFAYPACRWSLRFKGHTAA